MIQKMPKVTKKRKSVRAALLQRTDVWLKLKRKPIPKPPPEDEAKRKIYEGLLNVCSYRKRKCTPGWCDVEYCRKKAWYGYEDGLAFRCKEHGIVFSNLVLLMHSCGRCPTPARFGSPDDKTPTRCSKHKKKGMIEIK